jgi:hypothetical protein
MITKETLTKLWCTNVIVMAVLISIPVPWRVVYHIRSNYSYIVYLSQLENVVWFMVCVLHCMKAQEKLFFWLWFMVFNSTFNNISVISWLSVYWWRKPEYPEKTTDMSQFTESCFFIEICSLLYHSVNVYKTTVMSWQGILEWTLKDKA